MYSNRNEPVEVDLIDGEIITSDMKRRLIEEARESLPAMGIGEAVPPPSSKLGAIANKLKTAINKVLRDRSVTRAMELIGRSIPALNEVSLVMSSLVNTGRLTADSKFVRFYDKVNSMRLFLLSVHGSYHMYLDYFGTVDDHKLKERALKDAFFLRGLGVSSESDMSTTTLTCDMMINMKMFLKHIAETYRIIDVMSDFRVGEEVKVSDFISDAISGLVFGTTHIILEVPLDSGYSAKIAISAKGTDRSMIIKYPDTVMYTAVVTQMQSDMLKALCGKYLTVSEHRWDCDLMSITTSELDRPRFFNKEISSRISSICKRAFETKQKITILLYGKAGTGKTCALRSAIMDMDCIITSVEESPTKGMIKLLSGVNGINKIVIMEEVDSGDIDASEKSEKVRSILTFLDSDCFDVSIMTVNSVDIYSAILRSGRCDIKIRFDLPDNEHRKEIIRAVYSDLFHDELEDSRLEYLALNTDGFSPADLTSWLRQVYLNSSVSVDVTLESELEVFKGALMELEEYKKAEREEKKE